MQQPEGYRTLITERPYVSRAIALFLAAGVLMHVYDRGIMSLFTFGSAVFLLSGLFLSALVIGGLNYVITTFLARSLIRISAYSSEGIGLFRLLNFILTTLSYVVALYLTWVGYHAFYNIFV